MLPDDAVMYTASSATGDYENASIVVQSTRTGQRRGIHRGGYHARYLPSGHIVYVSQDKLFAVGFDIKRLEIVGQAWPVIIDAMTVQGTGLAHFTFSQNGTFAYIGRGEAGAALTLHWMTRDGKTQPARNAPARYNPHPVFSGRGATGALYQGDSGRHPVV